MRSMFALLFLLAFSCPAQGQGSHDPNAHDPTYTVPLGIALDSYPYPFIAHTFTLSIEGQSLKMAYMDVPPSASVGSNGRTVVLMHGKNFSSDYWESVIRALTDKGYRVIAPDQLGFGKSAKPDIHYSFDLLADNTRRLLDSLNIKKVSVVGHSMGGMLAIRFARTFPERVEKLVLEDPIGLEDYRLKIPPRTLDQLIDDEMKQNSEQIRRFYKKYFVKWESYDYERFVEVRSRVALGNEFPRWAKAAALTTQMIYQQPVCYELSLLKPPTLLVVGLLDRTTLGTGQVPESVLKTMGQYPALAPAAAKQIPDSRLVELPGVGHVPHLETPERFNAELLKFLQPSGSR